jgi:formate C-acetyltransferase
MSGCSESRLPNRETHKTGNGGINYGAVMEMTLRDGKMKIYNDEQFGLKTGDPRTFKTYDDVWNAYRLQLENVVKQIMIQNYIAAGMKSKYIAAPLASTLHDLCIEAGRDLHTHAEYIPGALDASCIDGLGGFATCIDSLAAIKHLIRVGRPHRLPNTADRNGIYPQPSETSWTECQHAYHSDHLS